MILTENNSTEMARADPDGAVEFDGAYFHANELTYASPNHDGDRNTASCSGGAGPSSPADESCGWKQTYSELGTDDIGYYTVPPLCPLCFQRGDICGVNTTNPDAKAEHVA